MYVLLDTSTPVCKLTIIDEENRYEYQWLAERQMAAGLLKYIEECLETHGASIGKVSGLYLPRGIIGKMNPSINYAAVKMIK